MLVNENLKIYSQELIKMLIFIKIFYCFYFNFIYVLNQILHHNEN